MSEETLKPLDLSQKKSQSQTSFESLTEVKTPPSFFQKIATFFSSNIVNYICTLVIIVKYIISIFFISIIILFIMIYNSLK